MRISVIGTGYVGLVTGVCLAEIGHEVTCIDIDLDKISLLKKGNCPIYEPGLEELLEKKLKNTASLNFSSDYSSIENSQVVFLAVGTPSQKNGKANLSYLMSAASAVAEKIKNNAIIIIKSTVPIGTSDVIREFIKEKTDKTFDIVSNPEFLREGSAVDDFMKPDRIIVGFQKKK